MRNPPPSHELGCASIMINSLKFPEQLNWSSMICMVSSRYRSISSC